jgi:hypothetical protein
MSKCRIKIAKYDDADKYDFSGTFSIYSDYSGAILVTSPPKDTTWSVGQTYSIRWSTTGNVGSYMTIQLYKDTSLISNISSQTSNDGVQSWSCYAASSGTDYRIKVSSYYDQGIYAFSEAFTITKGYNGKITVTNPTDTSEWSAGSNYTITWTDSGNIGSYVRINLYQDTGLATLITNRVTNSGSYSWNVPISIASGDDYSIKVESYEDNGIYDFSDEFSIDGIDVDKYERDNKRDSASSYDSLGEIQSRSLTLNDSDWVAFTGVAGRSYIVQTTGEAVTTVYLYFDQETSYKVYQNGNTSTKITKFNYTCDTTGTFYLFIRARSSSYYGDYDLKITEVDPFTCITFTAPTSSTTWSSGSTYSIQWQPDTALFGTLVRLDYCEDTTVVSYITTSNSNTGTQSWPVPANISTSAQYRIRMESRTYPGIFGYSQKFTVSGINPDIYEYDDERDSASTFDTLGTDQNRSLTLNDTDWVSFEAKKGETYAIQTVGQAITRVYLYYEDDATLLASANPNTSRRRTTLVYECDTSGTFYARVTCYSTSVSYYGEYKLRITEVDPFSSATFTAPVSNTTWSSGTSYSIQWQVDTVLFDRSVGLALCEDTTFVTLIYSSAVNDGDQAWSVPAGITTSSRYRIRMLNYYDQGIIGYSDTFTISGILPDTFEVDDSISQASDIAVDGIIQNHTLTLSDTDWVAFPGRTGMSYVVNTKATFNHRCWLFFKNISNQVDYKYAANNTLTGTAQDTGTFYVRVANYTTSGYWGPYTISVHEYDPNNAVNFINPTSTSTWSTGTSYSIEWTPDTAFLSTYVRLYLYQDTTLFSTIATSSPNDGIHPWVVTNGLESGKIYRIKISNNSNIDMFGFSDTFAISGIPPDTFEVDDTASTAHPIASGALEQHTLPYRDVDWYSLNATVSRLYIFETLDSLNTRMTLFSPNLTTILEDDNSGTNNNARIVWICTSSDTYFCRVYSSYFGSYRMQVTSHDSTAYKYTIATPTTGSSIAINDTCDITWSTTITLGGNVDLFLYNTGGVVATILANTADDNAHEWVIPNTIAPATDYRIKVANRAVAEAYGYSGVFTITAKE